MNGENNFAEYWQKFLNTPIRPSLDDLAIFEKLIKPYSERESKILILGLAPELRELCARLGLKVYCASDSEEKFVQSKQLMDKIGLEEFILTDWTNLSEVMFEKFDLIVADNIINFCGITNFKKILNSIYLLLNPEGRFICRTALRADNNYEKDSEIIIRDFKARYPELLPTQSCLYDLFLSKYDYDLEKVKAKEILTEAKKNFEEGFLEEQELLDIETKDFENFDFDFYFPLQKDFFNICLDFGLLMEINEKSFDFYSEYNPICCFKKAPEIDFSKPLEEEIILEKFAENEVKEEEKIEVVNPKSIKINYWFQEQYDKLIARSIKDEKDPKILVLGFNSEIRDLLLSKNLKFTILDKDIEKAKEQNKTGNEINLILETWVEGDWMNIPFVDNSFDLIISENNLYNISKERLPGYFAEIKRALKPLGALVLRNLVKRNDILPQNIELILEKYKTDKSWPDLFYGFYLYSNITSHYAQNERKSDLENFFKQMDDLFEKGILHNDEYSLFKNISKAKSEYIYESDEISEIIMKEFGNIEMELINNPLHVYTCPFFCAKKPLPKIEEWQKISMEWANLSAPFKLTQEEVAIFDKFIFEFLKNKTNAKILLLGVDPVLRDLLAKYSKEKQAEIFLLHKDRNDFLAMNTFISAQNDLEKYIEGDILDEDFKDNTFDLILADLFLSGYSKEERKILFEKAEKYLVPNGKIIFRDKQVGPEKEIKNENEISEIISILDKYAKFYEQNSLFLADSAAYAFAELIDLSYFAQKDSRASFGFIKSRLINAKENIINFNQKIILDYILDNFRRLFDKVMFYLPEAVSEKIFKENFDIKEKLFAKDNLLNNLTPIYYLSMKEENIKNEEILIAPKALRSKFKPSKMELEIHKKHILDHSSGVVNSKMLVLGVTPELRDLGLSLGFDVTAIEISQEEINLMNQFLKVSDRKNEKVILGNWLDINLPEDSFDVVLGDLSFNSIPFENYRKLLKKLRTVLKENGCMSIKNIIHPDLDLPKTFDDYIAEYRKGYITMNELYILCRFYLFRENSFNPLTKENKGKMIEEKLLDLFEKNQISEEEYQKLLNQNNDSVHTILKETEFKNILEEYFKNIKVKNTIENEYDKYLFEIFYCVPKKKKVNEVKIEQEFMKNWKYICEPHLPSLCDIYNYDKLIQGVIMHKKEPKIVVLGSTPNLRDLMYKYKLTHEAQIICLDVNEDMNKKMTEMLLYKNPQEIFLKIDWLSLPFGNNSIDLVVADFMGASSIEDKNKHKFYSEIQRVLKEDGGFVCREPVITENLFKDISVEGEFNKFINLVKKGEIQIKQAINWISYSLIMGSWYFTKDNKCSLSYYEQEIRRFDKKINSIDLMKNSLVKEVYKLFIENWFSVKDKIWQVYFKDETEKLLTKYFHLKDTLFSNDYYAGTSCPIYHLSPIKSYEGASQLKDENGKDIAEYLTKREGSFAPTAPEMEIYEKYLKEAIAFNDNPEVLVLGATPELRDMAIRNNCQTMAIDSSSEILEKMNEMMENKDSEKNIYLKGNWLLMDKFLRPNSYDVIIGDISLNKLDLTSQEILLSILKKLLKPGGKLILRNMVLLESREMALTNQFQADYMNNQNNWLMHLLSLGLYSEWKKEVYDLKTKELNFERLFLLFDEAVKNNELGLKEEDIWKYENIKKQILALGNTVLSDKEFEETIIRNFMIINKGVSGWKFSDSMPIYYLGQI